MENKKVFKFNGKPGEDFQLWMARTEAELESMEVLEVVLFDQTAGLKEDEILSPVLNGKMAVARNLLIRLLGDRPLRLCMAERHNPYRVWVRLTERYAVVNNTTRIQLQTKLTNMRYKNQVMGDYIDSFEEVLDRLAGMNSTVPDSMQVAMLLASFGDKSRSDYGQVVATLQISPENLSWDLVTARLLQEYEEKTFDRSLASRGGMDSTRVGRALAVTQNHGGSRKFRRSDNRRCFKCSKKGHIARYFKSAETEASREDNAMPAVLLMATSTKTPLTVKSSDNRSARVDSGDIFRAAYYPKKKHSPYEGLSTSVRNGVVTVIDSGATDHMVGERDMLHDIENIAPRKILFGDGNSVTATSRGQMRLWVKASDREPSTEKKVWLSNVILVPGLAINLISCSRLCENDCEVTFTTSQCTVKLDSSVVMQGRIKPGLYQSDARIERNAESSVALTATSSKDVSSRCKRRWHLRLGHANYRSLSDLARSNIVSGLDLTKIPGYDSRCASCEAGKMARLHLRKRSSRATKADEIIHSDVCGPMSSTSLGESRYYVSFLDEFSGHVTIVPIKEKSEVKTMFKNYLVELERCHEIRVKELYSDNGGEYIALEEFLQENGIRIGRSSRYCPEQNGISERMNRTVMDSVRSMLLHAGLPTKFWAEATVHAARVRNYFPGPGNQLVSSYQLLTGQKPDVTNFRVFGCSVIVHVPKEKRKKLDPRAEEGILLACLERLNYKVWMPSSGSTVIARHVNVRENIFPARKGEDTFPDATGDASELYAELEEPPSTQSQHAEDVPQDSQSSDNRDGVNNVADADPLLYTPPYNEDETAASAVVPNPACVGVDNIVHEISRYLSRQRVAPERYTAGGAFAAHSVMTEPTTYAEAIASTDSQNWKDAVSSELKALMSHVVWLKTQLPPGFKAVPTRLVFKRKRNADGSIERFKARIVVKGYMQGDVEFTYAPVVDFTTVRAALAVAVGKGYPVHQMDVKTAFLHGKINEEIYVAPPKGLNLCKPGEALKLHKGLYGLKQAPKLWNEKWLEVMNQIGFTALKSDACGFRRGESWMYLYVDDVALISKDEQGIAIMKKELSALLEMKNMGPLSMFLGVSFTRDKLGAFLSQERYLNQVLSRCGMADCKPVKTPMIQSTMDPVAGGVDELLQDEKYREAIGSLLYLSTRTRPDIAFAVGHLGRKSSSPSKTDWIGVKRIMRYLKGTSAKGVHYQSRVGTLQGYSDADWGGDIHTRRSTGAFIFTVGKSVISWSSKRQKSTALSSAEAEFMALSEAAKEALWLRSLLSEAGALCETPTVISVDNQTALHCGEEGVRKAKHVAIRRNFVKEVIHEKLVRLEFCPTSSMPADLLTKPLPKQKFEQHVGVLQMTMLSTPEQRKEGC